MRYVYLRRPLATLALRPLVLGVLIVSAVWAPAATAQDAPPDVAPDAVQYGQGLIVRAAVGAAFFPGTTVLTPNVYVESPFTILGGNLGVLATGYRVAGVTATSLELTGTYEPEFGGERLDPYGFVSIGWGISGATGFVYGGEGGIRYWLTPKLAANAYAGYVGAITDDYPKAGVGLAISL